MVVFFSVVQVFFVFSLGFFLNRSVYFKDLLYQNRFLRISVIALKSNAKGALKGTVIKSYLWLSIFLIPP